MAFVPDPLTPRCALPEHVPERVPERALAWVPEHALARVPRAASRVRSATLSVVLSTVMIATLGTLAGAPARAAVLGEASVRSYLGQKLDAEIEISSLTAAEAEALLVRIPAADAFTAAGIDLTPLVRSLRVTLEKRGDQTFVRLNSDQAVNDPFLMLLVELNAGGTRMLRQYALLIDPAPVDRPRSLAVEPAIAEPQAREDKAPASAEPDARSAAGNVDGNATNSPAASPAPTSTSPAAANSSATANARLVATTTRRVRKGDTLVGIGNEVKPEGVRLEQALVALQRANPQAFAGNNINRMKSGSVLSVPSADSMRAIEPNAARRIIVAQSADFQRYREALAERMNIPTANAGNDAAAPATGNRSSSGSVGVKVQEPGTRSEPQDQLKLTAPGQAGANTAAGTNDRKAIDQMAADKALADANSRIAALEKNLSQMEQMLEVRDRKLADAQQAAELAAKDPKKGEAARQPQASPEAASSSPSPAPAPTATPAPPSPGVAADAVNAQPGAAAKAPGAQPVTAARSRWSAYLHDPLVRAVAAGALLMALLAWLALRVRARRQVGAQPGRRGRRSKVNLVGSVDANSPAAGPARVAEAAQASEAAQITEAAGPQSPTPMPAVLAAVKDQVQGGGKAGGSDVDAIAEADVYIAYGRDEQAEEILRDALRKQPHRHALRVKLLEIHASRRDRRGFGELATELCALTGGKGSAWEQAAQMGQILDPGNPLYGSLPTSESNTRTVSSPLQAVPAPGKGGKPEASSSVDDFGLKLEGLLDEQRREQGKPTPPMQAPMQPPAASAAPDFSLSGVGRGTAGGQRIEPTLAGESDQAALTTKLDLALACKEIGDDEGARELLTEVAAARDPELSRRAQDMLRKMA